ncbi:MAG TPA: helix-turn-helix domain-containing protein [Anaerolineales bacterium]
METTSSFGYWVRRQRKSLDLTQQQLADQVGCSLAAIKKIETDQRRPSRQIAERLADSLGVPANQRGVFLEVARGLRAAEQLPLTRGPSLPTETPPGRPKPILDNLPVQLTSFIGRERELSESRKLLATTHLLTLTGPGGTGKTRLSLQLASGLLNEFADGVWLVELAPVADPGLTVLSIASAMGVREQPRRTILEALVDYVRAKEILLLLDNCEHLLEICAQLANTLLRAAPGLKIIATSREALGIAGETTYRVPSLPLPGEQQLTDLQALSQNDCVHLFMDRAAAAEPSFHLKDANASAIAEICQRLDGIPLAIELAAARSKVFPPEEIARRLDDRFRLLTGGSRTALERHQTLFALIDWSHNLLSEGERILLRRLSVFAGGWSFDAAQEICSEGLDDQMLELLSHLADKSLLAVDAEKAEARYRLPETIRQYARDRLYESGEAEAIRDRHREFFLRFAEHAEPKLRSAAQLEWLDRLEIEYDNLRAALAWSLESGKGDHALQLAGALYYYWVLSGHFTEMYKWLNDALSFAERQQRERAESDERYVPTTAERAHRAKALYGAAISHFGDMDVQKSRALIEQSLRLWRELGDKWWTAVTLELAALMASISPEYEMALDYLEEGLSLARAIEDPWPLAVCLIRFGDAYKARENAAAARPFLEEGVALARRIGDRSVLSEGLRELGSLYYVEGEYAAALSLTEEALANGREIGSLISVLLAYFQLVIIACLQNDQAMARQYCWESWTLSKETGSPFVSLFALFAFGLAASIGPEPAQGVRLLAATQVSLARLGMAPSHGDAVTVVARQVLERAQARLDPEIFQAAWTEGQQMTLEQALALATQGEKAPSPPAKDGSSPSAS